MSGSAIPASDVLRIFVSHSHKDDKACHALIAALRDAGADVWYDEHNMESGRLMEAIDQELRKRPVFVMILSPAALASEWVKDETQWAYSLYKRDRRRIILPVLVEPVKEDDIWLWLVDFRRIEAPGMMPFPEAERIRQTLHVLTLTPKGERPVTPTPKPGESVEELLTQGKALLAQEKREMALPFFQQAALTNPNSFDAWTALGNLLLRLQRYTEALPVSERATTLKPNKDSWYDQRTDAWLMKGDALRYLKRYEEALQAFDQARKYEDSDFVYPEIGKAEVLNELGRYGEALYETAIAIYIDEFAYAAWAARAVALRGIGKIPEAEEAERRAKELTGKEQQ